MLTALMILVIIDGVTGWVAAWVSGRPWNQMNYITIIRKAAIFAIVAIAHLIDTVLGNLDVFRNAAIFFYLANELLSVIENMSRLGVPIPGFLLSAVQIFRTKSNLTENANLIPTSQLEPVQPEQATAAAERPSPAEIAVSAGKKPSN